MAGQVAENIKILSFSKQQRGSIFMCRLFAFLMEKREFVVEKEFYVFVDLAFVSNAVTVFFLYFFLWYALLDRTYGMHK